MMNDCKMSGVCPWKIFEGIVPWDIDAVSESTSLRLNEEEEPSLLGFLDEMPLDSPLGEMISLQDSSFFVRKKLRKLIHSEKELNRFLNAKHSRANETLLSTRLFGLRLVKTLRRIKSVENAASSLQDFNSVLRCWKLLKDLLIPFGFLHEENLSGARVMDQSTHSSECRKSYHHAHLEILALTSTAAAEIDRQYPQFSTGLFEHRIWLRKQGNAEVATLSRHMVELVAEDIVRFALVEYRKLQKNNWLHLFNCGPYPCDCFHSSLLTTITLFAPGAPFSSQLSDLVIATSKITGAINKDLFQVGEEIPRSDVLFITHNFPENELPEFCLWLLSHVAVSLRERGDSGNVFPSKNLVAEKVLADRILSPILAQLDKKENEAECRYVIVCLQRIQTITGPQNQSLAVLLEYFFRHIDDSFTLLQSSVENWSTVQDDCFTWAKKWTNDDIDSVEIWSLRSNMTSFERFAHLLLWAIGHGSDTWKRVKGRLLSKFHTKIFSTLKESGWSHVFDLVLILAGRTNDATDFSALFCDVELEHNWKTRQECERIALIWRGFFAVLAACQYRRLEHIGLVRKVAAEFESASKNVAKWRSDAALGSHAWSVILEYLEVLPGFLSENTNSLSTLSILINGGVGEVIQVYVDETKQQKLLTLFNDLLDKYLKKFPNWQNSLTESDGRHHHAFLNSIFINVLQPIKRLLLNGKMVLYPELAASICGKCTLFGCGPQSFGAVADSPTSIFQMFVVSTDIPCSALAVYLCQMLPQAQIMGMLKRDEATDSNIIRSWVRSVIELGQENSNVKILTSLVKNLPELSEFDLEHLENSTVFPTFVKRCGKNLNLQPDYSSRMAYQKRCQIYFSDLHKFMLNVMRLCTSSDLMDSCVGNSGLVIRHCSIMLYNRSKTNTTLRMVVETVLAACDNSFVVNAMRSHLSTYYSALSQLDLKLDQQAREIFSAFVRQTFVRFSSHSMDQHPLHRAIDMEQEVRPEGCALAITVICNSFMLHVALPQNATLAILFLRRLIPTLSFNVLGSCLDTVFNTSVDVYLKGSDRSRTDAQQLIVICLNLLPTCPNLALKFALIIREKSLSSMQSHPANLLALLNLLADTTPELLYGIVPLLSQLSNGISGTTTVYQTTKARESYAALLKKVELSRKI